MRSNKVSWSQKILDTTAQKLSITSSVIVEDISIIACIAHIQRILSNEIKQNAFFRKKKASRIQIRKT